MCGIVGVVLKTNNGLLKQQEDSFYQMLYADALRGEDSTGVIGAEKDSTFHIAKEATEAAWFNASFAGSKIAKAMWSDGKAFIGHNRKKTIGAIADATAHPFVVDNQFAMVHNGTLTNHKKLADTEVDSEALAIAFHKAFTEEDYKSTLEDLLGEVTGAYATASYDQRTHKVRLLRNSQRPMSMVETSNAYYFASEAPMLFWILARNGYMAKDLDIQPVPEHTLVTFDLEANTMTQEVLVPKKFTLPTQTFMGTGAYTKATSKTVKEVDGLSKNAYKKFRNRHIFKKIEFWGEDFIETNYPKTVADGETAITLMGVSDSIGYDHMLHAEIDLKDINLGVGDLVERLWTGRIDDVLYDVKSKRMTLQISNALPLPISFKGKPKKEIKQIGYTAFEADGTPIIDAEYIQRKLDAEEKAATTVMH
jgi:glucosamine 6-phosphate synthetase-like amidotransferase/phosphosugar isomerase protein